MSRRRAAASFHHCSLAGDGLEVWAGSLPSMPHLKHNEQGEPTGTGSGEHQQISLSLSYVCMPRHLLGRQGGGYGGAEQGI